MTAGSLSTMNTTSFTSSTVSPSPMTRLRVSFSNTMAIAAMMAPMMTDAHASITYKPVAVEMMLPKSATAMPRTAAVSSRNTVMFVGLFDSLM